MNFQWKMHSSFISVPIVHLKYLSEQTSKTGDVYVICKVCLQEKRKKIREKTTTRTVEIDSLYFSTALYFCFPFMCN